MAKNKTSRTLRKKELRTLISSRLQTTLKEFEPLMGEKKYQKRIKKASKLLTTNLKSPKGDSWDNLKAENATETHTTQTPVL